MFRYLILLTYIFLASSISAHLLSNNDDDLIFPERAIQTSYSKESIQPIQLNQLLFPELEGR
jgi:hypothetical protein